MTTGAYIGILSGVLGFVSYAFYITSILRGKTIPNRVTWWVWAFSSFIIATSYYSTGAENTMWFPISEVAGPCIVAILSIWKGEGGWLMVDRISLGGAILSIVFWVVSGSALLALLLNLAVDVFAAIPTMVKSYIHPESEDIPAWAFVFIASILNIFAAETWSFTILVHPVYFTLVSGAIFFLLIRKRFFMLIQGKGEYGN